MRLGRRVLDLLGRIFSSRFYFWCSLAMNILAIPLFAALSLTASGWWAWIGPVLFVGAIKDARKDWKRIKEEREERRERIVREIMES